MGSGQLTAEGGVFVAQPPSESIKISDTPIRLTMRGIALLPGRDDTPIRLTMRGIALLPGRDERLTGQCFLSTIILLQKLCADGVVLPKLCDVATVQSGGDLVAAEKAGHGSDRHGSDLDPKRKRHDTLHLTTFEKLYNISDR